ncbi:EAL domain-containing protein [Lacisediminimonas sp.]|uniref:GGDEF/EAL domain-containing response regulator n=1 Tax=Lacisediminimonas sp. TaxID=3060582 RepID=UPI002720A521|nr:EAL domain-containing response regulator [Lacisediminimonas sp.]MDO8298827.1 EAL domain-containing response regulator [Lacisediminimonas sp.]
MSQGRLLILDDDAAVAQTIASIAEDLGFDFQICSEPDAFFGWVEKEWPTHIALDLVMPAMDGVEVLRLLAERSWRATIIVTSGIGTKVLETVQRSAAERGLPIAGILPKPFGPDALRALLGEGAKLPIPTTVNSFPHPSISESDLDDALLGDQFVVHYQPKVRLSDGDPTGFEALVRWQHPRYGMVFPDSFIPLAEETGQILPITYRIFDLALSWFSAIERQPPLSLAINLSQRNLTDLHLADQLLRSCTRLGVAPSRINLELTETSAITDRAAAFDILTRLRIKGFNLSIDDFGSGYSSMQQLVHLPFSEIKIDKSFVLSMTESIESRKIVDSIVNLGHTLGLTTVAEGVETLEALQLLRELRCELGQGYYFAKPMDGAAAIAWLAGHGAHPETTIDLLPKTSTKPAG